MGMLAGGSTASLIFVLILIFAPSLVMKAVTRGAIKGVREALKLR